MNLQSAFEAFLSHLRGARRAPLTLRTYAQSLQPHIALLGADAEVGAITPGDIDIWAELLGDALSPATIRLRFQHVTSFWRWLEQRGYVARSPVELEPPRATRQPVRNRTIKPEVRDAMLAAARIYSVRVYALMRLLADAGCRASALCDLRIGDIDWETRTAVVKEKGSVRLEIQFAEETEEALRAWLKMRPDLDHDCVFATRNGKPIDRRQLRSLFRTIARRAGVEHERWNPHAWRHEVAVRYFEAGCDPGIVQQKLGHATPAMTLQYYRDLQADKLRQITEQLSPGAPPPAPPPVPPSPPLRVVYVGRRRREAAQ